MLLTMQKTFIFIWVGFESPWREDSRSTIYNACTWILRRK